MATKMIPSSRKPPLVRSPISLRSRRVLQSAVNPIQTTPPGSLNKASMAKIKGNIEEMNLHPEYQTISCELRALAKMVQQDLGQSNVGNGGLVANITSGTAQSPLFERGRFYEEYSARRTERLKRKKGVVTEVKKPPSYNLGVRVESVKKREVKRFDNVRTSTTVYSTPEIERRREASSSTRYSLRSTAGKESKKVIGAKTASGLRGIRKN